MSIPTQQHESLLVVTTKVRDHGRLDFPWPNGMDASLPAIQHALQSCTGSDSVLFGGGEPTLRPDFLDLLKIMPDNGILATDGLALHQSSMVEMLVGVGLNKVQLSLHSARADAHNWLVGMPGAHKRVCTAIKILLRQGVDVRVESILTRPTTPYLEELVAFLYRLGVRNMNFRMLERAGAATDAYITLAPRFGLMEPSLEAAMQVALRHGMNATMTGLPHCATPRFAAFHIPEPTRVLPADVAAPEEDIKPRGGCPVCGEPCIGAPSAYTDLFGWTEFAEKRGAAPPDNHVVNKPLSGIDVPAPPPRAYRTPATRVHDAITQSQRYDLAGDPIFGLPVQDAPTVVSVRFPIEESTRTIKKRLVYASQQGADILQIVGGTDHPHALSLFRECQRLSFSAVVFCGDLSGLAETTARDLFSLRGLTLILYPPTDINSAIAQRIHQTASVDIGPYLTLQGSELDPDIVDRWANNEWPGAPRFAIHREANTEALMQALSSIDDCPEKAAAVEALQLGLSTLFGEPGSAAIQVPAGVTWPNLCSFAVE